MTGRATALFMTGATGLIGSRVLRRLLAAAPGLHAFVLVRDAARWTDVGGGAEALDGRVTPLVGDITREGLGLDGRARRALARRVGLVVHAAADTVFSRPLPAARRVNVDGTEHVLELAAQWPRVERTVHVSTAFVAGRRTGPILEHEDGPDEGFVNSYERSKFEAERLVRSSAGPWVILRPSTVVCDGTHGRVSQLNAVHRALRLYHAGLASMLPGGEASPVDLVTADYVADCVSAVTMAPGVEGSTFHVCAGRGAIGLGRLLDDSYAVWAESHRWRRRGIARPAITDLETYRLFERTVEQTGDARLRRITRSLSHFVPQLALPKCFDTTNIERVTGRASPPVADYWERVIRYLVRTAWAASARLAGSTA
jgi:long-chain acyl-CoA synthetase